jgi:hypothetical protein
MHKYFSLNDAADALGLERMRLQRLGRYLCLAPADRCIPDDVIERARVQASENTRYHVLLDWLLGLAQSSAESAPSADR